MPYRDADLTQKIQDLRKDLDTLALRMNRQRTAQIFDTFVDKVLGPLLIFLGIAFIFAMIYGGFKLNQNQVLDEIQGCRSACRYIANMPRQRGGYGNAPCVCSDGTQVATFNSDNVHYVLTTAETRKVSNCDDQ